MGGGGPCERRDIRRRGSLPHDRSKQRSALPGLSGEPGPSPSAYPSAHSRRCRPPRTICCASGGPPSCLCCAACRRAPVMLGADCVQKLAKLRVPGMCRDDEALAEWRGLRSSPGRGRARGDVTSIQRHFLQFHALLHLLHLKPSNSAPPQALHTLLRTLLLQCKMMQAPLPKCCRQLEMLNAVSGRSCTQRAPPPPRNDCHTYWHHTTPQLPTPPTRRSNTTHEHKPTRARGLLYGGRTRAHLLGAQHLTSLNTRLRNCPPQAPGTTLF